MKQKKSIRKPLHVCILSSNLLGIHKQGGFGSMTRQLARSLVAKGYQVTIIMPIKNRKIILNESFEVKQVSLLQICNPMTYKNTGADIFHSQNPTLMTAFAYFFERSKKHVVTARDPRDSRDWFYETKYSITFGKKCRYLLLRFFEGGPLINYVMRRVDVVGAPAKYLTIKAKKVYGLKKMPIFLPNIEDVPQKIPKKTSRPSVIYVGRLAGIKNPERFFELARNRPGVDFVVVGAATTDDMQAKYDAQMSKIPNLKYLGHLGKFDSNKLDKAFASAWVIVNTSIKEGLPMTFVEAGAQGCAILSKLNPENFSSDFGYHVQNDEYEEGLDYLIKNDRWKSKGIKAHKYVYNTYRRKVSVSAHEDIYRRLMDGTK